MWLGLLPYMWARLPYVKANSVSPFSPAHKAEASARNGAKRTPNNNFRDVRPLARIVLVAGFEAFNLQLYNQVVSAP